MSRLFSCVFILCVLMACASVGLATAQDGTLVYGDTATGVIDGSAPEHVYRFTAQAGDVVVIALTATSGDLDPLLILTDANDRIITQDDDSGDGRNALITCTIEVAGAYRIVATRYDRARGNTSGEFQLSLTSRSASGAPSESMLDEFGRPPDLGDFAYEMIACGDTVSGAISDEVTAQAYAFPGRAGETVTLSVRRIGGDLALRVALFDRTGQTTLVEAEDAEGVGELAITHILPETAYYVIGVGRVDGNGAATAGDYELTLEVVVAETPTPPAIDIMLTWNTVADLDLALYYPSTSDVATSIDWRNIAYPADYPLPAGVAFDTDGNGFCQNLTDQPGERITWDASAAPTGNYEVLVQYQFACISPEAPVDFEITLTVDGQTQTIAGVIDALKGEFRTTFAR